MEGIRCNRRLALAGMGGAGLAMCFGLPARAHAPVQGLGTGAVGSTIFYFNDGLMTDPGGSLPAHRRPQGYRGARGAAKLSAAQRIAAGLPV